MSLGTGSPVHGQAACSPCCWAGLCCQDGCQVRGCPARHLPVQQLRLGWQSPGPCSAPGLSAPSLPPTLPAKERAQAPEGGFVQTEAGASPAEQSRRLRAPASTCLHCPHNTWPEAPSQDVGVPGKGQVPSAGLMGRARLMKASDAPALGQFLTVPCALAELP